MSNLSAGIYELVPSKAGFAEAAKTVVEVGAAASVPVDLTLDDSGQSTNAGPQQPAEQEPERRAAPQPLDGVFPSGEYLGPTIGVPDTEPTWPLTKACGTNSQG